MKTILALGASNSKRSINQQLATFAAGQIKNVHVDLIDLNHFEMPIYSIDREQATGIHDKALEFKKHIDKANAILISLAEHNGSFSAAYKNLYDWVSRIDGNVWQGNPMFLLATSPGPRGAKGVLAAASERYRRDNHNTIVEFSLPSFSQNFDTKTGITDPDLKTQFEKQLSLFENAL